MKLEPHHLPKDFTLAWPRPGLFPSGLIKKRSLDQVRHLKQVFDEAKHNLIGESNTNPAALWICHGFEWVKRYTSETWR